MNLKGARLEEEARTYLAQQGYFAVRSASFLFDDTQVTDLDVWAYGRHGAGTRVRAIVDAKSRRSPKALERIVWAKGMKAVLNLDHVFVATTEQDRRVAEFAQANGVMLLPKNFLERAVASQDLRLSLEDFASLLETVPTAKLEGWGKIIDSAKSALVSRGGFAAFNHCTVAFKFFLQRLMVNPRCANVATRCALLMAAYAAISLDSELSKHTFESSDKRFEVISKGIRFGDSLGGKFEAAAQSLLAILSERMENGRTIAAQANAVLSSAFAAVRSEVLAEFFARENGQVNLVRVARELEAQVHAITEDQVVSYSVEQKQFLGVLADFLDMPRRALLSPGATAIEDANPSVSSDYSAVIETSVEMNKSKPKTKAKRKSKNPPQPDLI